MLFTARKAIACFCALLVISLLCSVIPSAPHKFRSTTSYSRPQISPEIIAKKGAIAEAFQHAWNGYSTYCFGHDTLHPVTNSCEDDFGGWGATAIDSLSTAIILGKEDVVLQILTYISTIDFKQVNRGTKIYAFEVIIRHFGGMISAWDLLDGPFKTLARNETLRTSLYDQMIRLGDVLSCAYDTLSGVPRDWVDPAACATDSGTSNTVAGVGTAILEFARLSDITGDTKYVRLAQRAEDYLIHPNPASGEPFPGLLGSYVSVDDRHLLDSKGTWGAFADSFYEYLIKAYMYNGKIYASYLDRWLLAADSTIRFIGSHPYGHPEWTLLPAWDGASPPSSSSNYMESLSWFAGGNFILGGMVTRNETLIDYGLSLADTAGHLYNMTTTGLGAEFVMWDTQCEGIVGCSADTSLRITDAKYRLRPEVLETWYHAYRATRNQKYRDWSWAAFEAINKYCRTDSGFSAILDVNAPDGGGKNNVQETFVFAEVMKYIYLTHLEDDDNPFHVQDSRTGAKNTWIFNTEAHPIRVVGPPK